MKRAALGARALAVLVDGLVTFFAFGAALSFVTGHAHVHGSSFNFTLSNGGAIVWSLVSWSYWIVLEAVYGTTLGKRLVGIRVVGPDGKKPTWKASAIRNLLRVVDMAPYFVPYVLGFVVALRDDERRRLGDRVAGTRVVS